VSMIGMGKDVHPIAVLSEQDCSIVQAGHTVQVGERVNDGNSS